MQIEKRYIKNFDIILVLIVVVLVILSVLMIGNATGNPDATMADGWRQVVALMDKTQALKTIGWFLLGTVAAAGVIFFDYHNYGKAWKLIYWGSNLMLAAVLLMGKVSNGTKGWLTSSGSIQPSEIAKLALIIVLAKVLSDKPTGIRTVKEFGKVLLMVALPLGLIIGQPDFGTMLVYVFITIVMLFVSGTDLRLLGGLFAVGGAMAYPIWTLIGDTQRTRILALFNPSQVSKQALYNVQQSITAIGAGQMTGRGFFAPGSFCQLDYVPAKETDFIFSISAETMGFLGSVLIIGLYLFLLVRLIVLSRKAFDRFGSYLIIGVAALIGFHVIENIGMTIGVMPCTGIPLPFLSYGGSSMVTNLIAIGLVENVCIRRRYSLFRESETF